MGFCTKCGSETPETDSFCGKCGAPRAAAAPQTQSAAAPVPAPRRRAPRWLVGSIFAFFGLCALIALLSPDEPQQKICPAGKATEPLVRAVLGHNGIQADKIKSLMLLGDGEDLHLTLDTGEWFTISKAGLETHVGETMKPLHGLAACFPALKTIEAELVTPAATQRDEHGNEAAKSDAMVVSLNIDCADLRKYRDDFDWTMYGVYAANRYVSLVNFHIRDLWDGEVREETKLGGFQ
jgi:hypothetical protein